MFIENERCVADSIERGQGAADLGGAFPHPPFEVGGVALEIAFRLFASPHLLLQRARAFLHLLLQRRVGFGQLPLPIR